MVAGRVLEPDQSKRPLHAARRKNTCSVVGCTAKAKASLLCKTKTKKTRASVLKSAVPGKKHSKKGSARCSRFAARLLSPANVHVCTDHGAHGIYSARRCKIIAAHGNKKRVSFTHSIEDKATCSCSRLQQRPSSPRGLLQYAHRARVLRDWWVRYGCWERWSLHEACCLWALHFEYLQYCR